MPLPLILGISAMAGGSSTVATAGTVVATAGTAEIVGTVVATIVAKTIKIKIFKWALSFVHEKPSNMEAEIVVVVLDTVANNGVIETIINNAIV
tara:strand:+ start:200 stop:481 length:282 start_codon:yes stop_codon:yes gene_type:complete